MPQAGLMSSAWATMTHGAREAFLEPRALQEPCPCASPSSISEKATGIFWVTQMTS